MDPIFDFATNVQQVRVHKLPSEPHFNHIHKREREKDKALARYMQINDLEISKNGKTME
jgi:hypothetical protein